MGGWIHRLNTQIDTLGERLRNKELRIPVDLTAGIVFLIFAIVIMLLIPSQVVVSDKDVVNGRAFPSLLMWVMIACSGTLIVKEVYKILTKQPLEWKTINLQTECKALVLLGILFGTYLISKLTGLFVLGAIFCCLGFLLYFRCKKRSYYVITLSLAVIIWAAFRFVLHVEF